MALDRSVPVSSGRVFDHHSPSARPIRIAAQATTGSLHPVSPRIVPNPSRCRFWTGIVRFATAPVRFQPEQVDQNRPDLARAESLITTGSRRPRSRSTRSPATPRRRSSCHPGRRGSRCHPSSRRPPSRVPPRTRGLSGSRETTTVISSRFATRTPILHAFSRIRAIPVDSSSNLSSRTRLRRTRFTAARYSSLQ